MLHLPSGGGMNKKIAALLGMALALLFATASLYRQVEQMRTEMAGLRQTITGEVTKLGEAVDRVPRHNKPTAAVVEPNRQSLDSLKQELSQELATTKRQAAAAAQHAKDAVSHADQLLEQFGEERQNRHQEVAGELGQIKEAEATTARPQRNPRDGSGVTQTTTLPRNSQPAQAGHGNAGGREQAATERGATTLNKKASKKKDKDNQTPTQEAAVVPPSTP